MSSRTRIVLSVALLFALATALSTLALRQVLLARVDARIQSALAQEAAELQQFAEQVRVADARTLFDQFLARDVPDEAEASFTFVGEQPYRSNADLGASQELIDGVRDLGDVDAVERGDLDDSYRYLAVPVNLRGERVGTFVVTSDLGRERGEVAEAVRVAAGIGFGVVVLVSLLAFATVGRVLAPLDELGATARSIESGDDLTRRIDVRGGDDIAELGHLFNAMLDRLEMAFALQREFVSDAGHELRTPITIIRGHLQLLDRDPETYRIVSDELDRMSRFVEDLLTLAKSERPDFLMLSELDLDLLTDELMAKAKRLAPRRWTLEATGAGLLRGDRQRLTQAVMNLAHNAVQHTHEGDTITLGSAHSGTEARLWVADTGPGVAEEDRERIFERYAGDGTGLGLAIVRTIALAHGGRVELESDDGARFTIVLPAS
ncbi:HAMP domain-containing protein [Solirubrobacter sp. CPCC 204708]|uniref:histidine kinase n=1 Tax=Solirubrobacter deserti TaxID=2282478 RepID=A0ABT4RGH5_9ACTN|nr:ATP-binding protein [Solirubrobacter deserti]MBE2319646.1 HAMP domain-containing protein [Solirubrobacter deserti]MDA0137615.1 ATP-binding protein [Solirubrobacter deserti]